MSLLLAPDLVLMGLNLMQLLMLNQLVGDLIDLIANSKPNMRCTSGAGDSALELCNNW